MCGIVAYIGYKPAGPILLEGLKRLEYRGYDSAGLAVINTGLHVARTVGRVRVLEEILKQMPPLAGTVGIAHTLRLGAAGVASFEAANVFLVWVPILALAWLRRGRGEALEAGTTVCGSFLLLYGTSSFWAWQYLAWSIPFFLCLGRGFGVASTLLLGGYVYGAYAFFTGSPWLQGRWDFASHTAWPPVLVFLRDASVLLCFGSACLLLVCEARALWRRRQGAPA